MRELTVNYLPGMTWTWLKMNSCNVKVADESVKGKCEIKLPEDVDTKSNVCNPEITGGMGPNFDRFMTKSGIDQDIFIVKDLKKIDKPVIMDFKYEKEVQSVNQVCFNIGEGSEVSVIQDFTSIEGGLAAIQTKVRLKSESSMKLYQIIRVNEEFSLINDVAVDSLDNSNFELIQILISGKNVYLGCKDELQGKESTLNIKTGYQVKHQGLLDINYNARHTGKNTLSDINVNGVLSEGASKTFRGTIDLVKGCSGAKGNEMEDVLLMSDDVVNQTIPLILCDEDDVEGNHGATIGQIPEDIKNYMMSRGIPGDEIARLMADSKVLSVVDLVPDGVKVKELHELFGEEVD